MLTFDTSYSYDRISLKILGNSVKVTKFPLFLRALPFVMSITNESGEDVKKSLITWPEDNGLSIGHIKDGIYYINIYTKTKDSDTLYWSYLQPRSLAIRCVEGNLHFIVTTVH